GAYTDLHNGEGIRRSINETGRAYYGDAMSEAPNHKVYQHIKKLNAIRKAVPALQNGNWNWAGNAPGNGVGYTRQSGSSFVCVGLAKDGSATFNFSGIPNGVYRDAVTGREINVGNGSLQFTVASTSAGIYVKDGPGMIGESGAGYFEPCVTGCVNPVTLQINPVGTNYDNPVSVTMSAGGGTGNKMIYYTLDGSMPSSSSIPYTGAFNVSVNTTVRAIAVDANGKVSELQAQRYTFEKKPPVLQIIPASGNYFNPVNVTISASEGTAPYTIHYTTDGSNPDEGSTVYVNPITVGMASTIKAVAKDANGILSSVVTRNYTFNIPAPTVVPDPMPGNYSAGSVSVSLSAQSPRPPVTIRYTINGSEPTDDSPVYTAPLALSGGDPDTLRFFGTDAEGRKSNVVKAVYTFYPIPDIIVYFKRPANWGTNVRIHFFNAQPAGSLANSVWPGQSMTKVCGDWYMYRFSGVTNIGIVFNDGAGRQTADLSTNKTDWYNGSWLGADPGITKPNVNFSADPGFSGSAPFAVTFNGSLSSACNGIQSYEWIFGNGQTGSGAQPTTTFSDPGSYPVKLIVTDNEGLKDSLTRNVQVTSAAEGFWVYFKKPASWANSVKIQYSNRMPGNQSIAFPGENMIQHCGSWYKYFFANTSATGITFSDGGTNQFTGLHANANTSFTGNKKVLGAPSLEEQVFANFEMTPVTGKQPLLVSFNPEASIACSGISSYLWNFGNGQTSTDASPQFTYQQQGVYNVNLRITDQNGQSHQLTKKIVVGPAEGNVIVHFRRPSGWNNTPNTYFWNPEPSVSVPSWPGSAMADEGNGWFVYTISGAKCANIIFNNNSSPQTADLMNICGEQWFDNGWLSQIVPEGSLPVSLLEFSGRMQDAVVHLQWQVAAERDVDSYIVERSTNGTTFVPLFTQPARNVDGVLNYHYSDAKLPAGEVVFYRLMMLDKDGSYKHSRTIKFNIGILQADWTISPNPVRSVIRIQTRKAFSQNQTFRIINASGQVLISGIIPQGQTRFDIERKEAWRSGVYWIEFIEQGNASVERKKLLLE
nr:starch-binding protein [Chitinophagaceae bacterium]